MGERLTVEEERKYSEKQLCLPHGAPRQEGKNRSALSNMMVGGLIFYNVSYALPKMYIETL